MGARLFANFPFSITLEDGYAMTRTAWRFAFRHQGISGMRAYRHQAWHIQSTQSLFQGK
jgi:hypothetical protein